MRAESIILLVVLQDPCAGCNENFCCRDWNGVAKGCSNSSSLCCYDGTICPFCSPNSNITCCSYFEESEEILTCDEGLTCAPATTPGALAPTECVYNGTACEGCTSEQCCRDWLGEPKNCLRNSTNDYCCYDGSVCPFCALDSLRDSCCSYNKTTAVRKACELGESCFYEPYDQSLQCRLSGNCSECFVGTQCCLVNNVPDACVDTRNSWCCLDGVHCQKSVCIPQSKFVDVDVECCSGAKGLFCPRGAYTAADKYCSQSANINTCQDHPRKLSCAECVTAGLECCLAATGEFFGCYDPEVALCCVLDGSHCNNLDPFPCSTSAGFPYNAQCCRFNGTGYEYCPRPDGDQNAIYCVLGGGCSTTALAPPPPEFNNRPPPYSGSTIGSRPIPPSHQGPIDSPNVNPPTAPGPASPGAPTPGGPSTPTNTPNSPSGGEEPDSAWRLVPALTMVAVLAL